MPKTTPSIKVESVKGYGAKIVLVGDNFDEALEESLTFCKIKNLPFIHPFDDPFVIAGQGTIGKELLDQFNKKIDIIVGTQITSKGHHFPDLDTVGILNMDTLLNSFDLRSSERVYQLIICAP